MKKRCRFCAEMIDSEDHECRHCGKVLVKNSAVDRDGTSVVSLDSWSQKSIPAWVMYVAVAVCLFCIWVMYSQGCDKNEKRNEDAAQETQDFR